jgi:hypothetical protein
MAHGKSKELADIKVPEPVVLVQKGNGYNRKLRRQYGLTNGFEKSKTPKIHTNELEVSARSSNPEVRKAAKAAQKKSRQVQAVYDEINTFSAE